MALYQIASSDDLSDTSDDFEVQGETPRCLATCKRRCLCVTNTKRRRVISCVVTLLIALCLAGGGTALALYIKGFFIPTCGKLPTYNCMMFSFISMPTLKNVIQCILFSCGLLIMYL